jgi:hypothetical protein
MNENTDKCPFWQHPQHFSEHASQHFMHLLTGCQLYHTYKTWTWFHPWPLHGSVIQFFHFTLTIYSNCKTDRNSAPTFSSYHCCANPDYHVCYIFSWVNISSLFLGHKDCPQIVLEGTQPKQAPDLHVNLNVQNSHTNFKDPHHHPLTLLIKLVANYAFNDIMVISSFVTSSPVVLLSLLFRKENTQLKYFMPILMCFLQANVTHYSPFDNIHYYSTIQKKAHR